MSIAAEKRPIRIIGAGNPDRSDDGVGRRVVRSLSAREVAGVEVSEVPGEATEVLALLEATTEAIWIVDACQTGAGAGTVHRFDLASMRLPESVSGASTHGFGVSQAIELARVFDSLPGHCIVFAIEACQFERGGTISAAVAQAADVVAERIEAEVAAFKARRSQSA